MLSFYFRRMKNIEIKIKGKEYSFKFGTKFVRELDKVMPFIDGNMEFGMGLSAKVLPELRSYNVNTLSRVLEIANRTEEETITLDEMDDYIDEVKDIEKLFDEVLKELAESNAGKLAVRNLNQKLKEAENNKRNRFCTGIRTNSYQFFSIFEMTNISDIERMTLYEYNIRMTAAQLSWLDKEKVDSRISVGKSASQAEKK